MRLDKKAGKRKIKIGNNLFEVEKILRSDVEKLKRAFQANKKFLQRKIYS